MVQYTLLHKMSLTAMNSAYSFGTLPLFVAIHVLRCEVRLRWATGGLIPFLGIPVVPQAEPEMMWIELWVTCCVI